MRFKFLVMHNIATITQTAVRKVFNPRGPLPGKNSLLSLTLACLEIVHSLKETFQDG